MIHAVKNEVQFVDSGKRCLTVSDWLEDVKIHPPAKRNVIVQIYTSETVYLALRKLADANVLSAPLLDLDTNTTSGLVDMLDFMQLVLDTFGKDGMASADLAGSAVFSKQLTDTHVLQNLSRRNPFIPVPWDATALRVMTLLGEKGAHRVCVMGDGNKTEAVLSQSAVVAWINKRVSEFGPIMAETAAECGFVANRDNIVACSVDAPACDAFRAMMSERVSAVALVDGGRLAGCLAASDIKAIRAGDHIDLSVLNRRSIDVMTMSQRRTAEEVCESVTCQRDMTLGEIVQKLATQRVHRLFVVDEDRFPVGVVSLKDVIQKIVDRAAGTVRVVAPPRRQYAAADSGESTPLLPAAPASGSSCSCCTVL